MYKIYIIVIIIIISIIISSVRKKDTEKFTTLNINSINDALVGNSSTLNINSINDALVGNSSTLNVNDALVGNSSTLNIGDALVGNSSTLNVNDALVGNSSTDNVNDALVGNSSTDNVNDALVGNSPTDNVNDAYIDEKYSRLEEEIYTNIPLQIDEKINTNTNLLKTELENSSLTADQKSKITNMLDGYNGNLKFSELENSSLTADQKSKITNFFGTEPLTKNYSEMYNLLYNEENGFDSVKNKVNDFMSSSTSTTIVSANTNNIHDIIQISTGYNYSLFLLYDGSVLGCGNNGNGQLGIGNKREQLVPVYVKISATEILSNVKQISAGASHAVFLLKGNNDGKVMSCGNNANGQLGDGTNVEKTTPVLLNISNVKQISAKTTHTMFLLNDGTVKGCGNNQNGQLGTGTLEQIVKEPVFVKIDSYNTNLRNVIQVSSGMGYTLFLLNDNTVLGCGYNKYGQLGDGTNIDKSIPVNVRSMDNTTTLKNIKEICAGFFVSLFILTDETLMGCGNNFYSQIGNNNSQINNPEFIRNIDETAYLNNVKTVSSGLSHTLILLNSGEVLSCGLNEYGELGDNTKNKRTSLVNVKKLPSHAFPSVDNPIVNLINVKNISAGMTHSLFLINDNRIMSCGLNDNGQLGHNTKTQRSIPIYVKKNNASTSPPLYIGMPLLYKSPSIFPTIPTNGRQGIDGDLYNKDYINVSSFGDNGSGKTGLNTTFGDTKVPTQITANITNKTITQVSAGGHHSLLLDSEGNVYAFGSNYNGKTGFLWSLANLDTKVPTLITSNVFNKTITQVSAGEQHSLLLDSEGNVYAFGSNASGKTGLNTTSGNIFVPTLILHKNSISNKTIIQVSAGKNHSLFLDSTGKVYSCGDNDDGMSGLGTRKNETLVPTLIDEGHISNKTITQVSAGANHSLFLDSTGRVYSCGKNSDGQLGHGNKNRRFLVPTLITSTNISNKIITNVYAGANHSLFLDSTGKVYSCGKNSDGRTGLNTTSGDTLVPTRITGGDISDKIITQISTSNKHSLFLDSTGKVYSCGDNGNGRTGLNTTSGDTKVPTLINSTKKITQVSAGASHSLFIATQ